MKHTEDIWENFSVLFLRNHLEHNSANYLKACFNCLPQITMKSHDNFKNGNQDRHRNVVHTCMYLQQGYQSHYSPRL